MRLISRLTPPAPKYKQEIQEVIDEGIESDEGVFLVRVDGKMDGGDVRIDSYLTAPGLRESFEKAGISHESYLTGQSAFLFTKMLVNNKLDLKGVFPPEALDANARAYYLQEAAKFELIVHEVLQRRLF
jgi:saccharopine dehydrogenase-like NADP-dependent oxidoreductase